MEGKEERKTRRQLHWAGLTCSLAVAENAETRRREQKVKCECLIRRGELRGRSSDYVAARIASTWLSIIRIYSDGYRVVILDRHSRFVSSSCLVACVR